MSRCKIVTSGVGTEYVLTGLSQYLRSQQYEVLELDFEYFKERAEPTLEALAKEKVIYITSAHMNLTLSLASICGSKIPEYYPNCLSPIEIISLLKPYKTFYIPHDLMAPYGEANLQEIRLLDLVDHVFATTAQEQFALSAMLPPSTQVHHAGWIKYLPHQSSTAPKIPTLLFLSTIEHYRNKYGVQGFVDYVRPLLTTDVHIKFPAWGRIDDLEAELRKQTNATIIPATECALELIQRAEVVICNDISSVHAESALMGKPTCCLLDTQYYSPSDQLKTFEGLPNIYYHDYTHRAPISATTLEKLRLKNSTPQLKPFDYGEVQKIIEQASR